jgi:hypothetical protein
MPHIFMPDNNPCEGADMSKIDLSFCYANTNNSSPNYNFNKLESLPTPIQMRIERLVTQGIGYRPKPDFASQDSIEYSLFKADLKSRLFESNMYSTNFLDLSDVDAVLARSPMISWEGSDYIDLSKIDEVLSRVPKPDYSLPDISTLDFAKFDSEFNS